MFRRRGPTQRFFLCPKCSRFGVYPATLRWRCRYCGWRGDITDYPTILKSQRNPSAALEDVRRRKYLVAEVKRLVKEGRVPSWVLSGIPHMTTRDLEDRLRLYHKNPILDYLVLGTAIGIGHAVGRGLAGRFLRYRGR